MNPLPQPFDPPNDLRILILAPVGKDAQLLSELLRRSDIANEVMESSSSLARAMAAGAGAALIAEEALTTEAVAEVIAVLQQQPSWSDFPLIVLTVHGEVTGQSQRRRALREPLGNVLLLERPLRPETLLGTIESCLHTRQRQYQMRRQMEQFKLAEEALRKAEKLAIAGRLAASIAHEINNPLESVMNLLYLMRQASAEDLPTYLAMAERELARVTEIAKQTLKFYREPLKPTPIDVAEILDSVLALYESRLTSIGIRVEKFYGPMPHLQAGAGELRQLFANIFGNAIDAMPLGGRLCIAADRALSPGRNGRPRSASGGLGSVNGGGAGSSSNGRAGSETTPTERARRGVRITVGDTGSGIPAEILGRIFEPFVTTKGDTGTGLGLWVVDEIVQKHGGFIRVRSSTQPGRNGTVFSIFLPTEKL